MTTPTPAQTLRRLCADWRERNTGRPDRVRRRIAETVVDQIKTHYPTTLAPLVGDPEHWTAIPEGRPDFNVWWPDFAVAHLGDNTWLHVAVFLDNAQLLHRLQLITSCHLHRGYRVHAVQHRRSALDDRLLLGSEVVAGDEEDLAQLLADLDASDCPGDCGSVARRDWRDHGDLVWRNDADVL